MEGVDLNLLRVFNALMEDGNLTRAGFRLGLSQPAMSHSLAKLRKITGNSLFVRVPNGMQPTDTAVAMAGAVRDGIRMLEAALEGRSTFDAKACTKTFQILLSDIGELVYLPRLMNRLKDDAPSVNVRALGLPREAYAEAFVNGEADLAIGHLPGLSGSFYQQRLFSDKYVCLVRKDHPRIRGRLTTGQFVSESHLLIEPGGSLARSAMQQTSTTTLLEHHLATLKLSRRVALRVPHFTVVSDILLSTDLVATLPSYVMRHMPHRPGLKMLQLPFETPTFEIKQFWHLRSHDDMANRWLRGVVLSLFGEST